MFKHTVLTAALAAAFATPMAASAADDKELAAIRDQIRQMKESYEARLAALEQRLQEAQSAAAQAQNAALAAQGTATRAAAPAAAATPAAASAARAAPAASAFNPSLGLVLAGTYANLKQDPAQWRLHGFAPADGEVGPGARSFNLGESELTLAANIDPLFSGQLTFALSPENEVGVEEAFIQTRGLASGVNLKAGRFMSGVGYLNSLHAHTWDFVDAPLAYQAFFGGQYKPDGVQVRWVAPTDIFLELGAELGSGRSYPGNDRNKNGAGAGSVFAHLGGDIGNSSSWRAGLSWLRAGAAERAYEENGLPLAFNGRSTMLVADAVYKWAPDGNATRQNFKLQGEYLRSKESGTLAADADSGDYRRVQSGWYLQGVYQFMPNWRVGLRHDRLSSGTPFVGLAEAGVIDAAQFPSLARYAPKRSSVMVDWSPSEYSRLRLQFARDNTRPDAPDNQLFLQYIVSMGAHAAHKF